MAHRGPHISISAAFVVNRILRINLNEFETWPSAVQYLATQIAEELFLVAYNPFIPADIVKQNVSARFQRESQSLAHLYATSIGEGITMFWSAYDAEVKFREELIVKLKEFLPKDCIITNPGALVETSTDATDLRMELPMLVLEPSDFEQISKLIRLANEMKFAIIPRGGGSGMTGGTVPARKRTVMINLTRLTKIEVNPSDKIMLCQAGVITQEAIDFANNYGLLFTVDPASKTASTIGGNVAENSGGPFCFEYGTTLDNLLAWRMVTPTGEIIRIERKNHPRHKILENELAVFEIRDNDTGGLRSVVELKGDEIRLPGLGKDVTNKALGGLPGMQKEGVDGIIIDAEFMLHDKPKYSRVMVLEFFGRSMRPAAELINKIVELRDRIREEGDYVRVSALEEFNVKYVQAIEYKRKSPKHEGDPISVIIVQVDGDDEFLLNGCVEEILNLVGDSEYIYAVLAKDKKEGEHFWEDRHRLSAISKRTSGFKMNEDVVIPMPKIPEFARFLELLNLEFSGMAYRYALQEVGRLQGFPMQDSEFNKEFSFASNIASNASQDPEFNLDISDDELMIRATLFLDTLANQHLSLKEKINNITQYMNTSRIIVASHMHAGDGNCHVNLPVNSNDPHMIENAEIAILRVMETAKAMGGAVSGEHGIGITKIAFLEEEKINSLKEFKERVDPREILNPGKLTQRELPVRPFTFSFNRLIADIQDSGLADKERFIELLSTVQACTRCGKCKQFCPMVYPERSYQFHPRNKNMILGAIIEAIYYTQTTKGRPNQKLLGELKNMVEHCTGCGRCTSVCPVKIDSAKVALGMLAFLKDEGAGGHKIKNTVLNWLANNPQKRIPSMAKAAAVGQKLGNTFIGLVPKMWRDRFESPLFSGKGPNLDLSNIYQELNLEKGGIFIPEKLMPELETTGKINTLLYFPGCGGSLFYRRISLATIALLTKSGHAVIVPQKHLCCGYPLLTTGSDGNYKENMARNIESLRQVIQDAENKGLHINTLLSACGSCRDSLHRYNLENSQGELLEQMDVTQLLVKSSDDCQICFANEQRLIYHASCHPEWSGVKAIKSGVTVAGGLEKISGASITVSQGCCGESGTGAYSSPEIYNALRERKKERLATILPSFSPDTPILVGCPSCKIGIGRTLLNLKEEGNAKISKHPVIHSAEWLADTMFGKNWVSAFKRQALKVDPKTGFRIIKTKQG